MAKDALGSRRVTVPRRQSTAVERSRATGAEAEVHKGLMPAFSSTDQLGFAPRSVWRAARVSDTLRDYVGREDGEMIHSDRAGRAWIADRALMKFSELNANNTMRAIKLWSEPGDHVLAPWGSRGVVGMIANLMRRTCEQYEIVPEYADFMRRRLERRRWTGMRADVHLGDAAHLAETPDASADFVFGSPPYWNVEPYADAPGQLASCKSYNEFLAGYEMHLAAIARVAKPGAFVGLVVGDWCRDGRMIPFTSDTTVLGQRAGLDFWDTCIWELMTGRAVLVGHAARNFRTLKTHETLLLFRKPGPRRRRARSVGRADLAENRAEA